MKKLKLLPTVLMLVLCVGVLAIGVYAISPTKNTITGTITINASNPAFTIQVYHVVVDGETGEDISRTAYGKLHTVRGGLEDLAVGELAYDLSKANKLSDVNNYKIELAVTSSHSDDLGMYFFKGANPTAGPRTEAITTELGGA